MAIAFDNHSSATLTFDEASIKGIPISNAEKTKQCGHSYDDIKANHSNKKHNSEEAAMFQQLLSHSENHSLREPSTAEGFSDDMPLSPLAFSLLNSTMNKTVTHQSVTHAASLSLTSTISAPVNGSLIAPTSHTIGQITNAISGNLNSLSVLTNGSIHSFSVLMPGQGNLNVSTQVLTNGIRSLQLNSDEKKFQSWLQDNASEITLALNKELNTQVQISVGASI